SESSQANTIVGPEKDVDIELNVPELVHKETATTPAGKSPTLWITVEESNDKQRTFKIRLSKEAVQRFIHQTGGEHEICCCTPRARGKNGRGAGHGNGRKAAAGPRSSARQNSRHHRPAGRLPRRPRPRRLSRAE